jgi:hypothetical protein
MALRRRSSGLAEQTLPILLKHLKMMKECATSV